MEIKCPNCGAVLQYQPGTTELACSFCGQKFAIGKQDEESGIKSNSIVPFAINKDQAITAARTYMKAAEMAPDDLSNVAQILEVKMFYFPVYGCSGEYWTNWTASFGYDYEEEYTEWSSLLSKWVTKTRTTTNWMPMSGAESDNFFILCQGTEFGKPPFDLPEGAAGIIPSLAVRTPLNTSVDYDPQFQAGCETVPFDISDGDAWDSYGRGQLDEIISERVYQNAQGDHQKDWNFNSQVDLDDSSDKILVPIALVRFEYKGKEYFICVNGANSDDCEGSNLPVDEGKRSLEDEAGLLKKGAWLPLAVAGLATVACVFPSSKPISWFNIGFGLAIAFAYYAYFSKYITKELDKVHSNSAAIRDALMMQRQAQDGQIDLNDEAAAKAAADSFNLPEKYQHHISSKLWGFTVLATVISAGIVVWPLMGGESRRSQANVNEWPQEVQTTSVRQEAPEPPAPVVQESPQQSQWPEEVASASGNHVEPVEQIEPVKQAEPIKQAEQPEPAEHVNQSGIFAGDAEPCWACQTKREFSLLTRFDKLFATEIGSKAQASALLSRLHDLPRLSRGQLPPNSDSALSQVEKYLDEGRFEEAIRLLVKLVEADRGDEVMRTNLAYALYKAKYWEEAASQSALAIIANPRYKQAWRVMKASCEADKTLGYSQLCSKNASMVLKTLGN